MHRLKIPTAIPLGDYTTFTDESDLTARYMIIGGITCGTSFLPDLYNILDAYKQKLPYRSDRLEWKAINAKNVHVFIELIDEFCELNCEHLVDFHALSIDMHNFDHNTINDGDREVSFDKMLFQNLYAVHSRYDGCAKIRCFHGQRDSRYPVGELRNILNNKAFQIETGRVYMPYAWVRHIAPADCLPMQLADLLIGCVGAHWNKRKGAKSPHKARVARRLLTESPVRALNEKTPFAAKHFDIWQMRVMGPRT